MNGNLYMAQCNGNTPLCGPSRATVGRKLSLHGQTTLSPATSTKFGVCAGPLVRDLDGA